MKHKVLTSIVLSTIAAALMTGCTSAITTTPTTSTPYALAPEPAPSAAKQLRNWEPTPALYANGSSEAGWSPFRYDAKPSEHKYDSIWTEPVVFAANMFTWPVTIWENRDRDTQVFDGVVIPPTSTMAQAFPEKPFVPTWPEIPVVAPVVEPVAPAEPAPEMPGEMIQTTQPTQ
jgi:hypothetical protein